MMDHDASRRIPAPEDWEPDASASGAAEHDELDRQADADHAVHGRTASNDPLRGFVVVRQFGARWGSDVAGSAFGAGGGRRPGIVTRFLALVLLVLLVVPVLILFVLIALVALVLGIVVSLVNAVVRPFRSHPAANGRPRRHDAAPGGPITDDSEGRHNVRVVDRR